MSQRFLVTVYPAGKQFDVLIDDIKTALCVVFALDAAEYAEVRFRP